MENGLEAPLKASVLNICKREVCVSYCKFHSLERKSCMALVTNKWAYAN